MIKIDVISGFLGAGKTTFANIFLNYCINMGEKPVFIVNEFGNTGIDANIIRNKGFKAIEMANGCICCTLKDDIANTIENVITTFNPTRIIFEPSGVFVFDNFLDIFKNNIIKEKCKIGNIITIVDGANYSYSKLIAGSFIHNQIKNSPILIISKTEQAGDINEIICDLKNVNDNSVIVAEKWSSISNEMLSDILQNDYNLSDVNTDTITHEKLQTITIKVNRNFAKTAINRLINKIKAGDMGVIFRVKGVVKMDHENHLLNISFDDVHIEKARSFDSLSLTFIGKELNKEAIKKINRVRIKKTPY